jgi:hypothetical protein
LPLPAESGAHERCVEGDGAAKSFPDGTLSAPLRSAAHKKLTLLTALSAGKASALFAEKCHIQPSTVLETLSLQILERSSHDE